MISAYRQPSVGGPDYHHNRPYVLAHAQGPYYVTPGHAAPQRRGYGGPAGDQLAYQLGSPASAVRAPAGGGGDRYAWKIAGFSECSQSCGGG